MKPHMRWIGRVSRYGAYHLLDIYDTETRRQWDALMHADRAPKCEHCGTPEPVGCECARILRGESALFRPDDLPGLLLNATD